METHFHLTCLMWPFRTRPSSRSSSTARLPTHADSCSESLFLYVFTSPVPAYAIWKQGTNGALMGLKTGFSSSLVENLDFAIPLRQVSYNSSVTLQEESPLVSTRIMATQGM